MVSEKCKKLPNRLFVAGRDAILIRDHQFEAENVYQYKYEATSYREFYNSNTYVPTVMSFFAADTAAHEPLRASDHANDGKYHLLLAATGSVATIKIPNIVEALTKFDNLSIRIVLTESAANFLQAQSGEQPSLGHIAKLKNVDGIYRDADEWRKPWVRGDNILHIELRRWADLMVIAPLSANSLAKVALGFSDNLVTSVVRAWDTTGMIDAPRAGIRQDYGEKKTIIVAPAMNTAMWNHPVTASHLRMLSEEWSVERGGWFEILRPIEKELACGDTGSGAMHDWKGIVIEIKAKLGVLSSSNQVGKVNGI